MALDVQPLSPRRHAAMLLVLLALLGASVGFAQLLVQSRVRPPMARYLNIIRAPQGFVEAVPAYESLEGAVLTGQAKLDGGMRRFVVFSYAADVAMTQQGMMGEAARVFERVLGGSPQGTIPAGIASLGPLSAVTLEGEFFPEEGKPEKAFLMQRLTALPGEVLAICYSGEGGLTDADRAFFNDFCETGLVIRPIQMTARGNGR